MPAPPDDHRAPSRAVPAFGATSPDLVRRIARHVAHVDHPRVGWAVAVAGPLLVAAVMLVPDHPRDYFPGSLYLLAVALAAALAGRRAAMAAIGLSVVLAWVVVIRPDGPQVVEGSPAPLVALGGFVAVSAVLLWLIESYSRTNQQLVRASVEWSRSEDKLRRLARADVIGFITGEGQRILEVNDEFLRMLGLDRATSHGLTIPDLTPASWCAADERSWEQLARQGVVAPCEKELLHALGHAVPVRWGGALIDPARESWVFFVEDLTEQRRLERAERDLRARAERLQAISAAFVEPLGLREVADVAWKGVVEAVGADACWIGLVDRAADAVHPIALFGWPSHLATYDRIPLDGPNPIAEVVNTGQWVATTDPDADLAAHPDLRAAARAGGVRSWVDVPLRSAGQVVGVLAVMWRERRELSASDRVELRTLANLCSVALVRAQRFEQHRETAEILQEAVLPPLTPIAGFDTAVRYHPASPRVGVGGDLYDVFELEPGTLFFSVGDVVGRGLPAAQDMALLQLGVRTLAHTAGDVAAVVAAADRAVARASRGQFATLLCGTWSSDGTLRLASAGHLPPVVHAPDGSVSLLQGAAGPPLGVAPNAPRTTRSTSVPPGSTLLVYTDGLVERRTEALNDGIDRLVAAVAGWDGSSLDALCDLAVTRCGDGVEPGDDVCVVALRLR